MSHRSGHIIITRQPTTADDSVRSATVELQFAPEVPLDERMKAVRRVEKLLDKLDHEDDE